MATGQLFYDPVSRPLSATGLSLPGAYYNFYVSGTSTPATVYQSSDTNPLTGLPYPAASLNGSQPLYSVVQADGSGAFGAIFLNPQTIYRVQLYTSTWQLLEDVDPYVPSMPVTGNGQQILDAQGEMTLAAPQAGGTGDHAHRERPRGRAGAAARRAPARARTRSSRTAPSSRARRRRPSWLPTSRAVRARRRRSGSRSSATARPTTCPCGRSVSYPNDVGQAVEGCPFREPQVCLGPTWANAYYLFFLTNTTTPANVYVDGNLTTTFPSGNRVNADAYGRFPAIYLDPSVIYRVQFFSGLGIQQWQDDPYVSQLSTVGTSALTAYGFTIAPTGEFTLRAPNTGGTGVTLALNSGSLGAAALRLNGTIPGNTTLTVNSSATTGGQTAVFSSVNKPGTNNGTVVTLTAVPTPGPGYVGGTLTPAWAGATGSLYAVTLSTGQQITGCTLTGGGTGFVCPSTTITGTPTVTMNVAPTPAGWLPIMCDTVQYFTPIWHGNAFTPYVSSPSANGEAINASSVVFGGNGITTATGGTASPGNWYTPTSAGIGVGYWINITKTSGLAGVAFTVAPNLIANSAPSGATYTGGTLTTSFTGNTANNYVLILSTGQQISGCTFTNSSSTFSCPSTPITGTPTKLLQVSTQGVWSQITTGGITFNTNAQASISGTYQLATTAGGTPVVASGTITLANNQGPQQLVINGPTALLLQADGTTSLNGIGTANWFTPSTGGIGADYWIKITKTSGTTGTNFTAASTFTNISGSGLTVGISGGSGTTNATGTYIISTDSAGVNQVATGTVTLNSSNVQAANYSGTTPLKLNGDGSATLNGVSAANWYSPTTSGVGSSYYVNITRTGGTAGVGFSAASGTWTQITNSGLTIDMTGTGGLVGTANVTGTYQISNSSSGTPVLGGGNISLSVSGLSVTHTYTTGVAQTEPAPAGTSKVAITADGGGGSGGVTGSRTAVGGGGGGGGEARSTNITMTAGQTLIYTVGAGGATTSGGYSNGNPGGASTVSSGTLTITTMTANGGGAGLAAGGGGAGGTATGGNSANPSGSAGQAGGASGGNGGAGASGASGGNSGNGGVPSAPGGGSWARGQLRHDSGPRRQRSGHVCLHLKRGAP